MRGVWQLVPNFGIAAASSVPWTLRERVFLALMALNSSDPAPRAAKISRFSLPPSLEAARRYTMDVGLMYQTGGGPFRCVDQFLEIYDQVTCPSGFRKLPLSSLSVVDCQCPPGLQCLCKPCVMIVDVKLIPSRCVYCLTDTNKRHVRQIRHIRLSHKQTPHSALFSRWVSVHCRVCRVSFKRRWQTGTRLLGFAASPGL